MEYNYTHGGDVYRNPIEYDFSINVNPLGMPLASIQAAHEGIVLTGRYPDYRAEQLCRAIAKAQNIPADRTNICPYILQILSGKIIRLRL